MRGFLGLGLFYTNSCFSTSPVVGEHGIENLVALVTVELEKVQVSESHARNEMQGCSFIGRHKMPVTRRKLNERTAVHVKPVTLAKRSHVGLYA